MGRIIFTVILLLVLTVLIVMSLGPTTPVNLFGARFQNIPVVAVAMVSFALGLVYSLFLYIGQYVHRASRDRLARKHRDVEERERKLAAAEPGTRESAVTGQEGPEQDAQQKRGSALGRFFGLFR